MTDGELVRRARDGESSAFGQLARRWSARVLAVCHARVPRRDVAEDLAQEALLRGLEGLASLRVPEQFGPWLRGIAVHVCLDWRRAHTRQEMSLSAMTNNGDAPQFAAAAAALDEQVERHDEAEQVQAQIHELPEELREILLLRYYDDMTYDQLADVLSVSRATVNTRLSKARDMLRRRLSPAVR